MKMASSATVSSQSSIENLIQVADYLGCFLWYALTIMCIVLLHTLMQHLRCPACLHQLVNAGIALAFLARNPSTWLVVTQNLGLYAKWIIVQLVLTSVSLVWVEMLYQRARNEVLKEEQMRNKLKDTTTKQQTHNDKERINQLVVNTVAELENLRYLIGIFLPLALCVWVLATSGKGSPGIFI